MKAPVILLVDDNEINLIAAGEILRGCGAGVTAAGSAADALRLCGEMKFDLIFMDYLMPGTDGREAAQMIRAGNSPNAYTPVIGLTANADDETRNLLLMAGMNDVIAKPVNPGDFDRILRENLPGAYITSASLGESAHAEGFEKLADSLLDFDIDARVALKDFNGDENAYIKVFRTFAKTTPGLGERLDLMFKERDWRSMMIVAHAMKSASATIGAYKYSLLAKDLEAACRTENIPEICRLFDPARGMVEIMCAGFPKPVSEISGQAADIRSRQKGDLKSLRESLAQTLLLIESLEHDAAVDSIAKEAACDHGGEINEILREILDMFDSYNYSGICGLISQLEEKI